MHALSTILVDASGTRVHPGTLLRAPAEFFTPHQLQFYRGTGVGWGRCPLGWDVLTRLSPNGTRIVVPAINLPDTGKPRRTFPDYRCTFSRQQIEAFAKTIIDEDARVEEARNSELANLTHDLRALSTEIYHAAELAKTNLELDQAGQALHQVGTVIAAQQMVSLRLDIVDYSTGKAFEQDPERIPVYKKVDKVYRCFLPKAQVRSQQLTLRGASRALTFGPPLFELIPFVLIENAMKYSPDRLPVRVEVSEDLKSASFRVISFGPRILPDEEAKIFEKGFRGSEAMASGQSGTGLGLYAAKSLVEQTFGGTLRVNQNPVRTHVDSATYFETTFDVCVPRID